MVPGKKCVYCGKEVAHGQLAISMLRLYGSGVAHGECYVSEVRKGARKLGMQIEDEKQMESAIRFCQERLDKTARNMAIGGAGLVGIGSYLFLARQDLPAQDPLYSAFSILFPIMGALMLIGSTDYFFRRKKT